MGKTKRRWIDLDFASADALRAQDIPYDASDSIKDKLDALSGAGGVDTIPISAVTSDVTLTSAEFGYLIRYTGNTSAVINLPTDSNIEENYYRIKNISTNVVRISGGIDGNSFIDLNNIYDGSMVVNVSAGYWDEM
jgi:hypothetical protein